jgi:site-specific recombinase XerD
MLQHGANPVEIQMLLGHASLDLLGQYLRLSISDIRAMHARSKLGQ